MISVWIQIFLASIVSVCYEAIRLLLVQLNDMGYVDIFRVVRQYAVVW